MARRNAGGSCILAPAAGSDVTRLTAAGSWPGDRRRRCAGAARRWRRRDGVRCRLRRRRRTGMESAPVHGGLKRGSAGIGDRSRRQAGKFVGVVGRVRLQIALIDGSAIVSLEFGGVDHGGIGGKGHVFCQAVEVNAGDLGRSSGAAVSFSTMEARVTTRCVSCCRPRACASFWKRRTMAAAISCMVMLRENR